MNDVNEKAHLYPEDVFKPGTFPEHTYVSRVSRGAGFTYELRLQLAIRTSGHLTVITGPEKVGKSVLCEKVVGNNHLIIIPGANCTTHDEFWTMLAGKVRLQDFSTNTSLISRGAVIDYYVKNNKVLLLDNLHHASSEMQTFIVQQLRDMLRKELRVIITTLPGCTYDPIREHPSLVGRISLINLEPWAHEELYSIVSKGFSKLGTDISGKAIDRIATESLASPQLAQQICLSACSVLECTVLQDTTHSIIDSDLVEIFSNRNGVLL